MSSELSDKPWEPMTYLAPELRLLCVNGREERIEIVQVAQGLELIV